MAGLTEQDLDFKPLSTDLIAVVPVSALAGWVTAIDAGGLTSLVEVSNQGDPAREPGLIADSSRRLIKRVDFAGTTLRIRMIYKDTDTIHASYGPLTIRVFGRTGEEAWTALRNLNGDASVPIPTSPGTAGSDTHYWDGALQYLYITQPDNNAHSWDCDGCAEFIIAVEQTYRPAGPPSGLGVPADAYLEAKIV